MHKPTIYEALKAKLGREPTNAELKADVERIKENALVEQANKGKLQHQRRKKESDATMQRSKPLIDECEEMILTLCTHLPAYSSEVDNGLSQRIIFDLHEQAQALVRKIHQERQHA